MKNLINKSYLDFEEDEIMDPAPKHLPYRFNIDKENRIRDSWEDRWEKRSLNEKYWQQCRRVDALLEKSIGKPFSEVYSKVCHEYPKLMHWGKSLKEYFMDQFHQNYRYYSYIGHYYVDEEGLIQYMKKERPKKSKRRSIVLIDKSRLPEYKVNHDEIQNHTSLMNTIYYTMGKEAYYRLLDSDTISEKFYNEIKQATHYDSGVFKIIDRMVWKHEYDKHLHKWEYKRIKAEDEDARKKKLREYRKEQEEYKDGLVQYLTWKRKQEAHPEPDEQNRDRHGFDEWSFKKLGENQ